jgi:hypothetical protein
MFRFVTGPHPIVIAPKSSAVRLLIEEIPKLKPFVCLLAFLFGLAAPGPRLRAQALGTIAGTVSDATGAAVPRAVVTALDERTNLHRSTRSNAQGAFVLNSLRPSLFTVTAEAPGFEKHIREHIELLADQALTLDLGLQVGKVTDAVTVEGGATQVDTMTGTLRQVIDQARLVELPLNGRNAATLTTLVAGAVGAPSNGAFQSSTFGNQAVGGQAAAVTVSTNGSSQTAVNYQLDGGDNVDQYTNVNQPFPMPDSLLEFSVQTSDYSAQYGQNAGAIVNVVTRSGSNRFHGGAFEFVRNSVFNARNWAVLSRDQIKRNQFGGTLGGPVRIPHLYNGGDKTFFFFGHQSTRFHYVSSGGSGYVPSQAALNGDFSAMLDAKNLANPLGRAIPIIDPVSGAPFPGNLIPVSRFDKAAVKTAQLLPAATSPNGFTRFISPFAPQDFDEETVRIDHALSRADRIMGRYFLDVFDNPAIYTPGNALVYHDGQPNRSQNLVIQEFHIFSPNILNDARFTFSRVNGRQVPPSNSPELTDLGVNLFQPDNAPKVIEGISVTGLFSFGDHAFGGFVRNNYVWYDDVKIVRGRHSIGFGGLVQRAQLDVDNNYKRFGSFTFSGDTTGYALADFFLGTVRSFSQGSGEFQNDRNVFVNVYAQDSVRLTRRFTLSLGLRYEPYSPWKEIHGRLELFRPQDFLAQRVSTVYVNAPWGLTFPGDSGFPSRGTTGDYNNLAPRMGFAWDPFGDHKTSIRGGVGAFYDSRVISQLTQNTVDNNPFSPSLSLTTPAGPFSDPYRGLSLHPPFPFPAPKDFVFPLPISVLTFDPTTGFTVPVTYNWNLTLERQVATDWLLRVAYVGSRGLHLRRDEQLNPVLYVPGAPAPYGNASLASNSRRLFMPGLASIGMETQTGTQKYHSLQVTLEKRLSKGLTVLAAYTWSKSLDDLPPSQTLQANGAGSFSEPIYVPGFSRFEYGPSPFDHAHRLVVSYVWQAPRLKDSPWYLKHTVGGWLMSGVLTAQTGDAFTIYAGTDRSATAGKDRAIVVGSIDGGNGCAGIVNCLTWFNPSAFAPPIPAVGTPADVYASYPYKYGNAGKDAVRGPGLFNWDIGIAKDFAIRESLSLQFRSEFFNSFNHVNYADPGSTISSAGFGTIRGAADPRIGQLGLKLRF